MAYFCWSCGNEQIFEVKVGVKVGRRDTCPHCGWTGDALADGYHCPKCGTLTEREE